jgi:hypothetical protein
MAARRRSAMSANHVQSRIHSPDPRSRRCRSAIRFRGAIARGGSARVGFASTGRGRCILPRDRAAPVRRDRAERTDRESGPGQQQPVEDIVHLRTVVPRCRARRDHSSNDRGPVHQMISLPVCVAPRSDGCAFSSRRGEILAPTSGAGRDLTLQPSRRSRRMAPAR